MVSGLLTAVQLRQLGVHGEVQARFQDRHLTDGAPLILLRVAHPVGDQRVLLVLLVQLVLAGLVPKAAMEVPLQGILTWDGVPARNQVNLPVNTTRPSKCVRCRSSNMVEFCAGCQQVRRHCSVGVHEVMAREAMSVGEPGL